MAAKRARTSGGSVTGGTGDVKPQILTLDSGTALATSEYVVRRSALPVPRFGTMKTMATVFELLAVDWYMNIEDSGDVSHIDAAFLSTSTTRATGATVSAGTLAADVTDPRTFAFALENQFISQPGGLDNGGYSRHMPVHIDLTDSNGNGMIIATDQIFVVGATESGTTGGSYVAKVLYRLVNVGIQEYVGIVQSQQGG